MGKGPIAESKQSTPFFIDADSGNKYELKGRVVTIGSSPDCFIKLPALQPAHVGHCLFKSGFYTLQVLSNPSPIQINGLQAGSKHILKNGDRIHIGTIHLEYFDKAQFVDAAIETADPIDELVNMVVLLLKNKDRDITSTFMTAISRLMRCDAARIVSDDPETGKRYTLVRYPVHAGLERFSNRAIDWAHEASRSILLLETDWADSSTTNKSLEKNAIASVICAPLNTGNKLKGYLYLDRISTEDPFTEKDRQFCDKLLPLLVELLENSHERKRQTETIAALQEASENNSGGIVYRSDCMHKVLALADRIAITDSPVLILGETGTGKELMARHIHCKSLRASKTFKAINCSAIPESLIESELFGYEKGAFTGANARKIGLFEAANGGTVFLDELGEMSLHVQVKLLRVLQESEVARVGSTESIKVDIRLITATNRDLKRDIDEGRFRSDLFFRLNVLSILIPPLRVRSDDILLLAEYLVCKYCARIGKEPMIISGEAREALAAHLWPGNIRELENVIQKAIVLSTSNKIGREDIEISSLPKGTSEDTSAERIPTIRAARESTERDLIQMALRATMGNVTHTSRILDIDRKWLITKMSEYSISADTYRK